MLNSNIVNLHTNPVCFKSSVTCKTHFVCILDLVTTCGWMKLSDIAQTKQCHC